MQVKVHAWRKVYMGESGAKSQGIAHPLPGFQLMTRLQSDKILSRRFGRCGIRTSKRSKLFFEREVTTHLRPT